MCFSLFFDQEREQQLNREREQQLDREREQQLDYHYKQELHKQRNIQREKEQLTCKAKRTVQYELEKEKIFPTLFTPPSYDTVINGS